MGGKEVPSAYSASIALQLPPVTVPAMLRSRDFLSKTGRPVAGGDRSSLTQTWGSGRDSQRFTGREIPGSELALTPMVRKSLN